MADVFSLVGPAKVLAKAIESKFLGTCTDMIDGLDHIQHDPHVAMYRIKQVQNKWKEVKSSFSESEQSDIESDMGLNVSDVDMSDVDMSDVGVSDVGVSDVGVSDVSDIPDPDLGSDSGIIDWILSLFS